MILGFIIDKLYQISTADDHTDQPHNAAVWN